MDVVVQVSVGLVKVKFMGKVFLLDMDLFNFYKLFGEGKGGVVGFVKGMVLVNFIV